MTGFSIDADTQIFVTYVLFMLWGFAAGIAAEKIRQGRKQ